MRGLDHIDVEIFKKEIILPTPQMCGDSSLSGNLKTARKQAHSISRVEPAACECPTSRQVHSVNKMDRLGSRSYATENEATKAATYFSKLQD